jgi:xanthine dehydrogenase small subunit
VTTADGLDPAVASALVASLVAHGASQCGFCTPGIVCRLAALGEAPTTEAVEQALLAHLCRCTGWRTIVDAATGRVPAPPTPDTTAPSDAAAVRAAIEGRSPQRTGPDAAAGRGGFAEDTAPAGALVAVPDGAGGWATGETLAAARAASNKRQGRRSGRPLTWPVAVPPGAWDVTLQTTWVEPGYLEPDASWCAPGGEPASPVANGGAFGGKVASPVTDAARRLAAAHGRSVRAVLSREDVVRLGPKRPPVAIGARLDGRGIMRVARTAGVAAAVASVAPGLEVEEVTVTGPATSGAIRAAGWAEAAVVLAGVRALAAGEVGDANLGRAEVTTPEGGVATAEVTLDAAGWPAHVGVEVRCGEVLDAAVVRSYAVGAAHMALGWVCSEAVAVDDAGEPEDLTIRSWGILRARDTPPVEVRIDGRPGPAVNGSDAVFAAVAAATWIAQGLPGRWPTRRGGRS